VEELELMAEETSHWAEFSLEPGYNPDVKSMRLTLV
jgi:hypothetical protein